VIEDTFFRLIDELGATPAKTAGSDLLGSIRDKFGLTHVAYLGINLPLPDERNTYIVATYNPNWVARYEAQNYVAVDPVVQTGMKGILPYDWASTPRDDRRVVQLFGEAREHGVGRQGLTFPIRGSIGERAWFSINADCSNAEWQQLKKSSMRDFQMISHYFHTHVLNTEGCIKRHANLLSKPEIECLKWAAAGKTNSETGQILARSASTVRFHLETARTKLHAVNKVQAVAKAMSMQLL
jgi:DNA-binding CsgD family transcriptional regulator